MKIDHLAIWVQDLERMKAFYSKYFTCESSDKYINPDKAFSSYFLSFDNGCRLELMHRDDVDPKRTSQESIGLAHFAVSVGSEEKVNTLSQVLQKDGYAIIDGPRTTGDGYYECVILDHEKNRIAFTV
jgi:lactoylglutathione lyase